jgi:FkbM family methyltransferase
MSNYEKCFTKHSFDYLNGLDANKFRTVLSTYHLYGDPVVFDVGCNAGSLIKVLKEFNLDKNVHCFEPHPVLSKKVKEVYPNVIMNEICIGNVDAPVTINIPSLSVGISSIIKRPVFANLGEEINELQTKCMKLDTYCKNIPYIDFIKIDVEGAEKMVFEGAHDMLSSKRIRLGMFEIGSTLTDAGTSAKEVCDLIESYGYYLDKNLIGTDIIFYCDK